MKRKKGKLISIVCYELFACAHVRHSLPGRISRVFTIYLEYITASRCRWHMWCTKCVSPFIQFMLYLVFVATQERKVTRACIHKYLRRASALKRWLLRSYSFSDRVYAPTATTIIFVLPSPMSCEYRHSAPSFSIIMLLRRCVCTMHAAPASARAFALAHLLDRERKREKNVWMSGGSI